MKRKKPSKTSDSSTFEGREIGQIEELLRFMSAHNLEEFEYSRGDLRIRMKKPGHHVVVAAPVAAAAPAAEIVVPQPVAAAAPGTWDEHFLALAANTGLRIHFTHGVSALSVRDGQRCAAVAEASVP